MKKILMYMFLLTIPAVAQINYNVRIMDIPNSRSGIVIGIPRQQMVCLSDPGALIIMWNGQYFYKTTDQGNSWNIFWDDTLGYQGFEHQHLCVWDDTIWNFSPNLGQDDGFVQVIDSDHLSQISIDTIDAPSGYSEPIYSGQRDGTENGMVLLAREAGEAGQYCRSNDRGRTWGEWMTMANYVGDPRIGLVSVGDSCMALIWNQYVDVWHWNTSSSTWSLEGNRHFMDSVTQRAFSGAVWHDSIWVINNNLDVSTTYTAKRQLGFGPITSDTLWHGNPAHRISPEYIGYNALQIVQSLDRMVAFYVHPSDGSSGADSSKLYIRVWDSGDWSPEYLVSAGAGTANLTCPFIVPSSQGNFAYCLFKDYNGGHLAVVEIDQGGIGAPRNVRWR